MSIKSKCSSMYLLLSFIIIITQQSYCVSFSLTIGLGEDYEDLINQFKEEVYELIQKDFMKTNSYLGRWLKAYNNNLEETIENFKKTLKWREAEEIDQILLEDYEEFDKIFPYGLEGFDKDGRPVIWAPVGTYDVRKISIAGDGHIYQRYLIRMLELCEEFNFQTGQEKGITNISQIVALFDLTGFNLKQGACFKCLTLVPEGVSNAEQHYPSLFHRIYYVNTPSIFSAMFNVAKNFMSQATKESIRIFDHDKNKYSQTLLQQIPADQLSIEYGGTKLLSSQSHSITKGRNLILRNLLQKVQEEEEVITKKNEQRMIIKQKILNKSYENDLSVENSSFIPSTDSNEQVELKMITKSPIIIDKHFPTKSTKRHNQHHHHYHLQNFVGSIDEKKVYNITKRRHHPYLSASKEQTKYNPEKRKGSSSKAFSSHNKESVFTFTATILLILVFEF